MTLAVGAMTGGFSATPMSQRQGAGKGVGRDSQARQELAFPLSESSGLWTFRFDSHFLVTVCDITLRRLGKQEQSFRFDPGSHRTQTAKPISARSGRLPTDGMLVFERLEKANEALALLFVPLACQADGKIYP